MPVRVRKIAPSFPLGANLPFNSRLRYRFRDAGIGQASRDAVPAPQAARRWRLVQLPLPKRPSVRQLAEEKIAESALPEGQSDFPVPAFPKWSEQYHRQPSLLVAPRFSTPVAAFHPRLATFPSSGL